MKIPWMCSEPDCENPKLGELDICASHAKIQRDAERDVSKPVKPMKPLRRTGIAKISPTVKHSGSDGTQYKQVEINELRKRTYDHMDYDGKPPFCSAHGFQCSEWMLDHDHTIAQARCKEIGKTELIWDEGNIEFSCRPAHNQWESYKSGEFRKHKNFERRMAFMKENDYEGFVKRMEVVELFNRPKETI